MKLNTLILTMFAAATTTVQAQSFGLDWFTLDGGGGTSSGGAFAVNGTAGQPDAGAMSGGLFTLEGGFWGVVATGPTVWLSVTLSNGVVTIYWDRPATGWLLDQTSTLSGTPIPWAQVPFPYRTNATHVYVTVPSPTGSQFYRLRKD